MFGCAEAERAAIEMLYEDTATVLRSQPDTSTSSNVTRLQPAPVYENVFCGLSYGSNQSQQTEAQHNIDHDAIIFAAPEMDIRAGDTIQLSRFGRTSMMRKYEVIGYPAVYATHQEIRVKEHALA